MINESHIKRMKSLAGIINEGITLTAEQGRSGQGTLGWYVEEYLLALCSSLISTLDAACTTKGLTLAIRKGQTTINENVLATKLLVQNTGAEIMLTGTVNLESASSTTITFTAGGMTNKFDLSSKHSSQDRQTFIENATANMLNLMTTEEK